MAEKITTRVIQISNVAPSASKDQMKTLFNHLGRIDEIKIYPKEGSEVQAAAKVCYVKYDDSTSVGVALHLTNTVFVDRALIVVPVMDGKIPDEQTALQLAPSAVAGMIPGQPTWPSNVISQLQGTGSNQVITTNDPRLNSLGLPQYPPLPGTTDPAKIEEIRRTVYVANLDPMVSPEQVMTFFSQVGEIKYVRMALEDSDGMKSAFVEFTDQRSVATSLTYNGVMFQGNHLRVLHSTAAINKPKTKLQEAAQREFEEAMKKVKEAQSLITAAADSGDTNIDKAVSRLASDMRSRSRSRSRRRRSRTRSRSRKRSRSRSRRSRSPRRSASRRSRSPPKRSPERRRSRSRKRSGSRSGRPAPATPAGTRRRSRSPKRRRSRSRSRKRRSKSRSKSRTKSGRPTPATTAGRRSRTPPPFRPRRSRSRTPKRSHSKGPRSRSAEKKRISRKSESASPPRLERQSSPGDDQASSASHKPDEKTNDNNSPPQLHDEGSLEEAVQQSEQILDEPTPTLDKESDVKAGESSKPPKRRSSSRGRSGSKSPRKIRRSRSRSKSKGHRPSKKSSRRSRSGSRPRRRSRSRKRSRSRSGSRHRARKDKKKDRERSRERDKDKEKSKKKHKDREREREREKEEKKDTKVVRDYDEEEKIYDDDDKKTRDTDQEETENDAGSDSGDSEKRDDSNLQTVDMDMSE